MSEAQARNYKFSFQLPQPEARGDSPACHTSRGCPINTFLKRPSTFSDAKHSLFETMRGASFGSLISNDGCLHGLSKAKSLTAVLEIVAVLRSALPVTPLKDFSLVHNDTESQGKTDLLCTTTLYLA